jgi:hypothetical protein
LLISAPFPAQGTEVEISSLEGIKLPDLEYTESIMAMFLTGILGVDDPGSSTNFLNSSHSRGVAMTG